MFQEGGKISESSLGTEAWSLGPTCPRSPSWPSGPGKPPPRPPPSSAPCLTLYPVGLPGGGSQLKWIFREPAALALGFCGAPRALWETGNADWVWFWKVRSSSSVVGEARAGQPVGIAPHTAETHSHHQGAQEAQCNTQL